MTAVCVACGAPFSAARGHARTCSGRCRKRLERTRRERHAALELYNDVIWRASRSGAIDADDTLKLLALPAPRVVAMLCGQVTA
jgi:predicted nucleic acid-binding Zn ribbon protein